MSHGDPRAVRAVVYDHDGTLVDSLAVVVEATNTVLRARGLPPRPGPEIIKAMVLPTAPRMGFHAGVGEPLAQRALAEEFYAAAIRMPQRVRVYDGVPAMVAAITARGLGQGVVSNNQGAFVRAALAHLGLAPAFGPLLGEEDIPEPKPSPSGLLLAAQRLGVAPHDCLFLGDSPSDAHAAHAAGMRAVGVTWGIHGREEMTAMGFAVLVDHPAEVLALLG